MNYKYNIALDAMGGDNNSKKVVEGLKFFEREQKTSFTLFGKKKEIEECLQKCDLSKNQSIFIEDCEKNNYK